MAVWALVGVNALWGLSFPIMKSLNMQMEHLLGMESTEVSIAVRLAFCSGMIGIRFFLSFVVLCVACRSLVRRATRQEWIAGVVVGLFFYFGLVLQVMGLATIPASRSGFLTSLTAVFTPLYSAILLGRLPSRNVFVGTCIAVAGVALLTGFITVDGLKLGIAPDAMSQWTIGDTLTTLGAILFTGQLVMVDYYGRRLNSAAITPGMFALVAVASSLTFLVLHEIALPPHADGSARSTMIWWELFSSQMFFGIVCFLAVFCSVFAFLGMNKYQPHITAVQASVIYSSEPVFASAWALFLPGILGWLATRYGYPNETLTLPLLLGGLLILIANIVALWPRKVI